jgi:hypothetical protein
VGLGALLVCPPQALATLSASGGALATARFEGESVLASLTSFPGGLTATISANASDTEDLPNPPYPVDFEYDAFVLGEGTVYYGSAHGAIHAEASSKPESVQPSDLGPPLLNAYDSEVSGVLHLGFQENVVVTGGAAGAPVTLTFHFMIQSTAVPGGGNVPPVATSRFLGRITDIDTNQSFDRDVTGTQVTTAPFDTAVGNELSIEGTLSLALEGSAGDSATDYAGAVSTSVAGLWVTGPPAVAMDAPSRHDYRIAVPEPSRAVMLLVAAGALLACGAGRRNQSSSRVADLRLDALAWSPERVVTGPARTQPV